ncbi:hypothetical protein Pmar_PMAR005249 [Perkinsus marinus ATCC 50983]|uniref:Uncharacterized protein n=1 Tax=Perkinsus marinus (strain ATCC 50983 / TXsc) TaxID=423536 RepID=C5KB13_PERM5|nr:hypothetical protein Pmar_PMAR005249 [Perkinsus marinus ATCC 50983]EER18339.1 hypothetical protein Pmar_PMAR005249 [Perkinsus marinus ATCC 50983]|eukprot:XP_002786543.1 hypothetical protein Pmar_PMAR005249 [Perkinsus marinus ATCC 50983]
MRNELGSDPLLVPEQDSAHLADEPLSIFSERPAEGLVGPLVWCDHMDLLATMHVTPQEAIRVTVQTGTPQQWRGLHGVGDENGDIASVYVEQKNTRADTTMAVLRRAHSAKVVAMEWVLTPFVVDESLNGDHCSLINWPHIRNLDDVRDANRRALEKADTVADYAKLVLGLQQLQRYIVDGINILLHGPLKSAAAAMKKLVGPLKAEMEEEGKEAEDDVVARSVTEELIRCFHGLGVPSPALSRALETIGYQTQALQKLQRELTEALDMFSVICAHQLEPAVDTLMASAHSIRLMAHNDHYAAILGDGHGGLHWAIDQLLTAGEHLTALLDEASSQVSYAIGCESDSKGVLLNLIHRQSVALPLITQLVRWQRMGERLGEIDDVELDEKERVCCLPP